MLKVILWILGILGGLFIFFLLAAGVCACMLSSRISQAEERWRRGE